MSKGSSVKKALIDEGIINLYKECFDKPNNVKKRYWNKNKNVVGDGVTNSKMIQMIVATKPPPPQTYTNPPQQSYTNPSLAMHVNPPR
ncbi:hypothetical protein SUGI_0560290 [Cryptomeria japonica]|nr:hypothetical protein SUGI_0560290 [Cryptomeria japonica]